MTKHIKNYAVVKKAMKDYFEREELSNKKRLKEAEDKLKGCEGQDYKVAECRRDVERYRECLEKILPEYKSKWEARLEAADKAEKLLGIKIVVHWSKSRTWGMNPHAEAWVSFEDKEYGSRTAYGKGRASGCGYDKRSAAMGEALCLSTNKNDDKEWRETCAFGRASIDRFVIEHGEPLWKEYAIDRIPLPHFCIDGKGSSVLTGLFKKIGSRPYRDIPVLDYLIDYTETDKGSDVYHIIRKDRV